MRKSTRLRLFGFISVLAATALICWQLLPATEAQEKNKLSNSTETEASADASPVDNTDDILLNAGTINVKAEKQKANIDEKESLAADKGDGERLHLVRFNGPIKSAWVDSLKRGGITIVDYIPHFTYLVWGNSAAIDNVRSAARNSASPIEWEGAYKPEYRVMPSVYANSKDERSGLRSDRYEIQLFNDEASNAETFKVLEALRRSDVTGKQEIKHYVNFVVGLDEEGLRQVAERPDVISIHPYIEPQKFDEAQSLILRGNLTGNLPTPGDYLQYLLGKGFTQAQFEASNFAVDVTDSGVGNADPANENQFLLRREGDPTQASRVIYSRLEGTPHAGSTLAGCDGHGNINATIIGGYVPSGGIFTSAPHADANGFRYGLGIAPFVKVGSSVIFDPDTFTSPNLPNLQARAYNDGARISSNSWGSAAAGAYTATSQSYDFLVRDAQQGTSVFPTAGNQEMVIVFAAGNDGAGAGSMGAPGTAKNLITVGASENVRAFGGADGCGLPDSGADSANDIVGFSSRGPTTDGRRKPDIVLPGTHVTGGAAQNVLANPVTGNGTVLPCFAASGVCAGPGGSDFFPTGGQQWYTASSGTSHSTPAISGLAALIRQHFINTAPIGGSAGSGTVPSPALTKALMMNTASYMNGSGANDNLPSNNQGMGLADLDNYFDVFDQDRILRDQQGADTFTDSGQERVFSGSVANTGKPFRVTVAYSDAPGATTGNAFVNNLDLEVIVGGTVYKGNNFLKGNSIGGGTADTRNNVESVFVPAGVSGNFLIRVKATNIAGDGLPANADTTDQDFALVVWNAHEAPVAVVSAGASAITAESCAINGAIDPAETVTVNFDLSNLGVAATTNLVATLQPTGGVSAPSGPQNYGALAPGGGAVTRPFTFTATTNCGQNLVASLQLQDGAADLGIVTFNFLTGALAAPTATAATTGNLTTTLPDNTTVQVPIEVTTSGSLSDLNVKVRLNHTFDGDLQMSITSPGGVTVPLAAARGGSGDNFGSGTNDCSGTFTVFDDSAASAISAGVAPFAGSFRPETPLAALNGQSITGTWLLNISDTATDDTGTLGCAQLEFQRQRYVCCGIAGTAEPASGGAPALLSESFIPTNNTPDPGESVTYNIAIVNAGDGPTTNLVATLQNSGGITPVTTSQSYGVINPASPAVVRPFTFIANGPCGGSVTATFQLQDGATNHGTISYTFQLGTTSTSNQSFTNSSAVTINVSGVAAPYCLLYTS
ncbi:MAG: S8 family serine peptidase [Pyrinomonadaceae bacterium]